MVEKKDQASWGRVYKGEGAWEEAVTGSNEKVPGEAEEPEALGEATDSMFADFLCYWALKTMLDSMLVVLEQRENHSTLSQKTW